MMTRPHKLRVARGATRTSAQRRGHRAQQPGGEAHDTSAQLCRRQRIARLKTLARKSGMRQRAPSM
jgi:hypothetical protein